MTLVEQFEAAVAAIDGEWASVTVRVRITAAPLVYDRVGGAVAALQPEGVFGSRTFGGLGGSGENGWYSVSVKRGHEAELRDALARFDAIEAAGEVQVERVTRGVSQTYVQTRQRSRAHEISPRAPVAPIVSESGDFSW